MKIESLCSDKLQMNFPQWITTVIVTADCWAQKHQQKQLNALVIGLID